MTSSFQDVLWHCYDANAREMPWRHIRTDGTCDPYHILVSELMLQQTQVARVIPKFEGFIERWPTIADLSRAPLQDILRTWSGLGYNRRAKYLSQIARGLGDTVPDDVAQLVALPGIGPNTAAAIVVYSYNQPKVFVETNIRTVILHHFFDGHQKVSDKEILAVVEQELDRNRPREWYWAMMDYGTHLKAQGKSGLSRSKAHKKQLPFEGSKRQVRGKVLKLLLERPLTKDGLYKQIADPRLDEVLADLQTETMIIISGQIVRISSE